MPVLKLYQRITNSSGRKSQEGSRVSAKGTLIQTGEIKNRFHFGYLDEDSALEKEVNLKLIQLLAFGPPGAIGVGLVEKEDQSFLSTVTIRSPFRNFTAEASGLNAKAAVRSTS